MERFFERKIKAVVVEDYDATQRSNKWNKIKDTRYQGSQTETARKEFNRFDKWNDGKYFLQMKPLKVIAAIDGEVQPK